MDSKSRKLARVGITVEALPFFVSEGKEYHFQCIKGVPDTAELVGYYFSDESQVLYLIFRHESFDEVPFGNSIPELRTEHKLITDKE